MDSVGSALDNMGTFGEILVLDNYLLTLAKGSLEDRCRPRTTSPPKACCRSVLAEAILGMMLRRSGGGGGGGVLDVQVASASLGPAVEGPHDARVVWVCHCPLPALVSAAPQLTPCRPLNTLRKVSPFL